MAVLWTLMGLLPDISSNVQCGRALLISSSRCCRRLGARCGRTARLVSQRAQRWATICRPQFQASAVYNRGSYGSVSSPPPPSLLTFILTFSSPLVGFFFFVVLAFTFFSRPSDVLHLPYDLLRLCRAGAGVREQRSRCSRSIERLASGVACYGTEPGIRHLHRQVCVRGCAPSCYPACGECPPLRLRHRSEHCHSRTRSFSRATTSWRSHS